MLFWVPAEQAITYLVTLHVGGGTPSYQYYWNGVSGSAARTPQLVLTQLLSLSMYMDVARSSFYVDELPVTILKLEQTPENCLYSNGILNAKMIATDFPNSGLDSVSWVSPSYQKWEQLTGPVEFIFSGDWDSIPHGTKTAIAYGRRSGDLTTCKSYRHMYLPSVKPDTIQVCLVTVDDTNQNVVVWDPASAGTPALSGFTIYREDFLSGDFEEIITINNSTVSEYTDKYSDAGIKSYRYKISVEDQCGMRSDPSSWHQASHLNVTRDNTDSNRIILNFQPYQGTGFSYDMLYIMLDPQSNGNWMVLDSIPSPLPTLDSFIVNISDYVDDYPASGLDVYLHGSSARFAVDYPREDGACNLLKAGRQQVGLIPISVAQMELLPILPMQA